MKSEMLRKSLSTFSLIVVAVYFLINSLLLLELLFVGGTLSVFADIVFAVDLFTWHIYGLFSIITFIIKITDTEFARSRANSALHLVFMILSFFEIFYFIQYAF